MVIGNIEIKGNAALAPMAGVADTAFRILCKSFGAGYLISEMVSAKGLCYNDTKTAQLCTITPQERPMGIQLFGSEPQFFAKAIPIILPFKPDFIDINMGCPVPKVVKQGAGSALMKTPALACDIIKAVKSMTDLPVTAKIRAGFEEVSAVPFAMELEKSGVCAIAVHGRLRTQYYSGLADRNIIAQVKKNVNIPVIGNGDIFNRNDISDMYRETNCDYVMIGRGSYGNPWIFGESENITLDEKIRIMDKHIKLIIQYNGESSGMRIARKHAAWYLKGIRNAAELRQKCNLMTSYSDFTKLIESLK